MGVFLILLVVPIMVQHLAVQGHIENYERKNQRALTFFFFFLTVLLMLRHESVGTDTATYIYYFRKFSWMDWDDIGKVSIELGFSYFNKIVSVCFENVQFFFAFTAIAISAMIYPTYKRLCLDASLTIVLFCTMSTFVMMFSGLRQMLAVGIGFVAYEFTRKKQFIPYVLAVCLALMFHTSAFMLFFMYPLYHVKITLKWLYAVVPAMAVIYVFNQQIFTVLGWFLERYTKYDARITQTGSYTMLVLFVMFAVFAFLIPDEALVDDETIGLRNFLLFSVVLQMFSPLHTIAMRMNYYYIIFIPLLIPKIIRCRSMRWEQVAIVGRHIMLLFFFLYFFFNAYRGSNLDVFPYHFFWEKV